jgi:DNA glycosylase AlkZ-like
VRARVPPRARTAADRNAPPDARSAALADTIHTALAGRELTRHELHAEIERRLGVWATAPTFPAFGGQWPRWQFALQQAALDGRIVFGPNRANRVTYVRTADWLGPLDVVDGQAALREVCRRFLLAYGPATPREFARWFATSPRAAAEVMRSLDLVAVDVEGWRAWLPREALDETLALSSRTSLLLLPQFDCYVVGAFPRSQLIPESAPAPLRQGTAAPFAVVLIDGSVGGLWQRRIRGTRLDVRVDAFAKLSQRQVSEVHQQAARVGDILGLRAEVSFGHVEARGHL